MEQRDDELEQTIEETRQGIEEKRASMTEKLELLEERFRDTLEETRSAVEGIVENVKETVDDTVGAVKETVEGAKSTVDNLVENVKGTMDETATMVKKSFDLNYQVDQRPWMMFGGSIFVGFMLGSWMNRGMSSQGDYFTRGYEDDDDDMAPLYRAPFTDGVSIDGLEEDEDKPTRMYASSAHSAHRASESRTTPSRWGNFTGQFQEEWDTLKGIAVGTLMGSLQTMVRQHLPAMAPKIEQAIKSASAKLGAEPIDLSEPQRQSAKPNGQDESYASSPTSEPRGTGSAEPKSHGWQGASGASTPPNLRNPQR